MAVYVIVQNAVFAVVAKVKSILNVQGQRNNKINQDVNTIKYYIHCKKLI